MLTAASHLTKTRSIKATSTSLKDLPLKSSGVKLSYLHNIFKKYQM